MSTPSSRSSTSTDSSEELDIVFESSQQVEDLYESLVEKYNDMLIQLEVLEGIDDDIQELREKQLDKYEYQLLAEAYEAAGAKDTAIGLRNQAEECNERIDELHQNLEGVDPKEHFYELYEMEIKKDTMEIHLKACEKYLEKRKRKSQMEAKKQNIRPASPRRYPKAASPSRLEPLAPAKTLNAKPAPVQKPPTPKAPTPEKTVTAPAPIGKPGRPKKMLPLPDLAMPVIKKK